MCIRDSHRPDIIILDEPTVAVDPQSRNNILEGIKKLNQEGSTIIYTSHYMDEVDFLCDDIVIIDKGKVLAKGTSRELKDMIDLTEKISLEASGIGEEILKDLRGLDHLISLDYKDDILRLNFSKGDSNLIKLISFLSEKNIEYKSISVEKPSLNDVFLELTGKDLRD